MIFISIQNRHINYREFFYVCPKTDILKLNIKKPANKKSRLNFENIENLYRLKIRYQN